MFRIYLVVVADISIQPTYNITVLSTTCVDMIKYIIKHGWCLNTFV